MWRQRPVPQPHRWDDLLKEFKVIMEEGDPDYVLKIGVLAYRTDDCDDQRLGLFLEKFEELVLKQWDFMATEGADPEELRKCWTVFWEDAKGCTMDQLRQYEVSV